MKTLTLTLLAAVLAMGTLQAQSTSKTTIADAQGGYVARQTTTWRDGTSEVLDTRYNAYGFELSESDTYYDRNGNPTDGHVPYVAAVTIDNSVNTVNNNTVVVSTVVVHQTPVTVITGEMTPEQVQQFMNPPVKK